MRHATSASARFWRWAARTVPIVLLPATLSAQEQGVPTVGSAAVAASTDAWAAALDRFREQIRSDVAADGVGGITAAVVVGDRMLWAEGFGWADRDRRIPAGVETIYRIGSVSKPVTAIALMQLVERDGLRLDDAVATRLPAVDGFTDRPPGAPALTFRHLATHTGGLIREPRLQGAASGPIERWEDQVLASIPATSYTRPPGEAVSYSNIGFGTLGLAVSRAAGRPFMELVSDGIFAPLGMDRSTFVVGRELEPLLAVGYANRRDGSVDAETPAREHHGRGYKVPNGGVYSTVGDLARLVAGMTGAAGDALLTAAGRAEMMRLQTPGDGQSGYGIGFSVRRRPDGRKFIGHGGSVAGYTAYLVFEPESGIGVILLRNYNTGATNLGAAATRLLTELLEAAAS